MSKNTVARQAAFKANITRKKNANRARYEAGEISRATLAALNAHVTIRAKRNGFRG